MKSFFLLCGSVMASVFMEIPSAWAQNDPVMDNNPDAVLEGHWSKQSDAAQQQGADYLVAENGHPEQPPATALYRPAIAATGLYNIDVFQPRGLKLAKTSSWKIASVRGVETVSLTQNPAGGEWLRLAENVQFRFGSIGYVQISTQTNEAGTVVVADGVRCTLVKKNKVSLPPDNHLPGTIVVDDDQVQLEGNWLPITSPIMHGLTHHYCTTQLEAQSKAVFRPYLRQGGTYDVDIWYSDGATRGLKVPWVITGQDGESSGTLSQNDNGGHWIPLFTNKSFIAGHQGFVLLHNGTGATGEVVVADAVRFIPRQLTGEILPALPAALASAPSTSSPVPKSKTFTAQVTLAGAGQVLKSPDLPVLPANSTVTFTAKPEPGHVFGGWSGDVERMKNPLTLPVNRDWKITANFWPAGVGVIMDNTDATLDGNWNLPQTTWVNANARYDDYQYIGGGESAMTASATYQPDLPRDGNYNIFVWYPAGENRATNAPWDIVSQTGQETTTIDQTQNGGGWQFLAGPKLFKQGKQGYARLHNKDVSAQSIIVADAVAFVFIAPP